MGNRNSKSSEPSLEQRVEAIEAELARLRAPAQGVHDIPPNGWRLAIDKYAGDEDLLSIFSEAQKLREADRRRARKRKGVPRRVKK
jgi:hypothetical protein